MQGSIKKYVGKRGTTWRAVVDVGRDPVTGKRVQRRVTAKTKRACEAAVAKLLAEAEDQRIVFDRNMTVSEFAERWLESKDGHVRGATHRRYADLLRLHVLPAIGGLKIRNVDHGQIQRLHTVWRKAGLSATSCNHAHFVLHGMLQQAVQWRVLANNPCKLVKAPRRAKPEITAWREDEVLRFLVAARDTPLEPLWILALCTGMRRGELLGLMWSDIDFDHAELSVRRTLSRGRGNSLELGTPKTRSAARSIALPALAMQHLRQLRASQGEMRHLAGDAWQQGQFVFTDALGRPLQVNALQRQFTSVIDAAGVTRIRIHDLRHTNATVLLAQDVHAKVVQERLGHSSIGMTIDTYSHVLPHMQQQAAEVLDATFSMASD
jgi:integrase